MLTPPQVIHSISQFGEEGSATDPAFYVNIDKPGPVVRLVAVHDASVLVRDVRLISTCRRDPCGLGIVVVIIPFLVVPLAAGIG